MTLIIVFLVLLLGAWFIYDYKIQTKHSLLRNFPIIGRVRFIAEWMRPKILQYFVETENNGAPIPRAIRSLVYQRAKGDIETVPFGTKNDLYENGTEFLGHSMYPKPFGSVNTSEDRIMIGNYSMSRMNCSAMSFGALSANAVLAVCKGAKEGNFAVNTGEGGLSEYHLKYDCDLIWQIGTGYFGCRKEDGTFSHLEFVKNSNKPQVKMIEIKISQGAKPGLGGVLPAEKNTPEIAKIRGVEPHVTIHSPTSHSQFSNNSELIEFIEMLKKYSGGKPVGIKICFGSYQQIDTLLYEFLEQDKYPDFITIDGAEGGTGAAQLEFTNNVGLPLYDALTYFTKKVNRIGVKDRFKIIASGKIFTAFDIIKAVACGADAVNSARGMMFALGCIHALECNNGKCPTGITTHNPRLTRGLVVDDKAVRVASYQKKTLNALDELLAAAGVSSLGEITPKMVFRRDNNGKIVSFNDIYFKDI